MTDIIHVVCYIDGNIIDGSEGVQYDRPPSKVIVMKRGITFASLYEKLCDMFKIDKMHNHLSIIYRYSHPISHTTVTFLAVPIQDDDDVQMIISKSMMGSGIELYLNVQPHRMTDHVADDNICIPVTTSCTVDDNIQMSQMMTQRYNVMQRDSCTADDDIEESDESAESEVPDEPDIPEELDIPDDIDAAGPSHVAPSILAGPSIVPQTMRMFTARSPTFTEIDWSGVNVPLVRSSDPEYTLWNKSQELFKGLRFATKDELQMAVKLYSLERHFEFNVSLSLPNLWVVKCKRRDSGCAWYLRARQKKSHGQFEIVRYTGPHTCVTAGISQDHSALDSNLIAQEIRDLVKAQPDIKIVALGQSIKNKFNYIPKYSKLWEAKQKAMGMVYGDWDISYQMLPRWLYAMQCYMPGSACQFLTTPAVVSGCVTFDRVFWAFAPSIEGFKYCRPVLSIDATFLYGKYKEKMMIATALDANDQIFPLCFGICEEESTDTWSWFLSCIRLYVTQREGICLMSDRHPGILSAVGNSCLGWQPPMAYHVFCVRHIKSNFNNKFKDTVLKNLVWKAAQQHQVRKFNKVMERLEQLNPRAAAWLQQIPLAQWTLSHDEGRRYGVLTTNMSESFNGVLKSARSFPITAMVELIYFRLVNYFEGRRAQGEEEKASSYKFTPLIRLHMSRISDRANSHRVTQFDRRQRIFEIKTSYNRDHQNQKGGNTQVNL